MTQTSFEWLTHERNISIEKMRAIILVHIEAGMNIQTKKNEHYGGEYHTSEKSPHLKNDSSMRRNGCRMGVMICCVGI